MSIYNTLTQGGDNYFNLALMNLTSMNKTKLHAIPSFHSFLIVFDCWGSIGVSTRQVGVAMQVGFGKYLPKVLIGRKIDGGWVGE